MTYVSGAKVTQIGDLAQLVSPSNKIYTVRLTPDGQLQTHRGVVKFLINRLALGKPGPQPPGEHILPTSASLEQPASGNPAKYSDHVSKRHRLRTGLFGNWTWDAGDRSWNWIGRLDYRSCMDCRRDGARFFLMRCEASSKIWQGRSGSTGIGRTGNFPPEGYPGWIYRRGY